MAMSLFHTARTRRPTPTFVPGLEALEQRDVPAVSTVNTLGDAPDFNLADGRADSNPKLPGNQTTLRAALQQANALKGLDVINFNLGGGGAQTISPRSPLPAITDPVII